MLVVMEVMMVMQGCGVVVGGWENKAAMRRGQASLHKEVVCAR